MKPNFERVKDYVIERLASELSPHLLYHSLFHTRDDVFPAAIRLGRASGLDDDTVLTLATAALFHDTGFLRSYEDHETHSIVIAREMLPGFGFSTGEIDLIAELIGATRMPQRPRGLMQELICDADLDLLGREDFMHLNRALLTEVRHYTSPTITEEEWFRGQTRFLEDHHFFTPAATTLRATGKARNLELMRSSLAAVNGHA